MFSKINFVEDDEKVFAAIKAGAVGYILKNAESVNLLEAVREVNNGDAPITPGIAKKVLRHFHSDTSVPLKKSR